MNGVVNTIQSTTMSIIWVTHRTSTHSIHLNSPFPPLPNTTHPPLAEFVREKWIQLDQKVAILDGSTGLQRTFADYHDTTGRVGAALQELGVGENSTVALFSPNHVDYLPISLGVSLCGAKLTPINPLFTTQELTTILDRSRSSVLIVHQSQLEVGLEAARLCPTVKHVIVLSNEDDNHSNQTAGPEGTIRFASIKNYSGFLHDTLESVHSNIDTNSFLLPYSSGTTGLPKGVCLTHQNIITNLLQCNIVEGPNLMEHHKLISPLPFFHIYASVVSLLYSGWQGQQLITMSGRFDLELFCQLLEQHQPERAHLVPPIILGMAKSPVVDKYDVSSLRQIVSAAAPLSSDIETAIHDRLGVSVKQAWGMSELSPIGTFNTDAGAKSGSVGPLVSSTQAKVLDKDGNSLPPNQPGELVIRGPQVMLGYLDDPDKTAECLSPDSGWLRTGDVAMYDEDGHVYVTDRLKELIKVRGYAVAPAELEALLLTNDSVQDVAVIQIPDEQSGELPRAYVVLKENEDGSTSPDDIAAWVKERVAPYKRLDGGVVFTDAIPKSPSGKILRRLLRDALAEELEVEQEERATMEA